MLKRVYWYSLLLFQINSYSFHSLDFNKSNNIIIIIEEEIKILTEKDPDLIKKTVAEISF